MPLPDGHLFFGLGSKLTDEQLNFVNSIIDNQVTIVNAPSGSGKTTLAVACARYLQRDLIYIFSPVEEDSLGYTPGTVEEKEAKYIVPLKDALLEINENPERVIESSMNINNIKQGNTWVKAMSHVFARGINIKSDDQSKKLVIIDETQNFTRGELKKILTRIHDNVKVVIIGHDGQCDLDNPRKSGFLPYIEHLQDEPYVRVCKLTRNFRGNLARKADELNW
jgi:PhoH-like ATPase